MAVIEITMNGAAAPPSPPSPPSPPGPPTPAAFVQPGEVPCFSTDASGVVFVVSLAFGMFAVGFLLWVLVLRRRYPFVYFFKGEENRDASKYSSWFSQVALMSLPELERVVGVDARLYLETQLLMAIFLGILCVPCVGVLLPLYFYGGENEAMEDCMFQHTTALHLNIGSRLMWPMVAMTIGVASGGFVLLRAIGRRYLAVRRSHLARRVIQNYSVVIHGLPTDLVTPDELLPVVQSVFDPALRATDGTEHPPQILAATPALEWKGVTSAYKKLQSARDGLRLTRALQAVQARENARAPGVAARSESDPLLINAGSAREEDAEVVVYRRVYSGCGCSRVDARQYFSGKAEESMDALSTALQEHSAVGTGVGFVVFSSPLGAWDVQHTELAPGPDGRVWSIRPGPDPRDIIWENLSVAWASKKARQALNYAVLVALIFFWQIPVGFTLALNALIQNHSSFAGLERKPAAHLVFAYLIPTLLLVAFRVGLPYALMGLALPERFQLKSTRERAVTKKYFWFLIVNTLILPMIVSSSSSAFSEFHDVSPKDFLRRLASSIATCSSFFMNYVIIVILVVTIARLVRTGPIFLFFWTTAGKWASLPPEELESLLGQPEAFEYYVEWVDGISIFAIAVCYATIAPLLLPAGVMYFLCKHFADRYNLLYVHPVKIESGGAMVPSAIIFIFSSLVIFSMASLGFILARGNAAQVLVVFVVVPLVLTLTYVYLHLYIFARDTQLAAEVPNIRTSVSSPWNTFKSAENGNLGGGNGDDEDDVLGDVSSAYLNPTASAVEAELAAGSLRVDHQVSGGAAAGVRSIYQTLQDCDDSL